ncbi:UDP-glucose 4-epimerase GalE [Sphingomonas sp.]|uniref:UDP-glucose 4-epimerase GalE n=1 Tax=Sphingomonas sp. TaxID=28214 RepID=UPI0025F41963|nr:UDP-glucose 4-epimerase GalE [Sphingomonas sp.]
MRILLTGGCGFIGSHTALALLEAGHEPVLLDNFDNSRRSVAGRLAAIAGRPLTVIEGDVRDTALVRAALSDHRIDAVIHFAGLKAVAESVARPLDYYANNVGGLLSLLEAMDAADVRTIVFSSSATVYGEPLCLPIAEDHPTGAINPYGQGKLICETILTDLARAERPWRVSILRYFNPVGAHPSGLIGEEPTGMPNNLMPLVIRAAGGKLDLLSIYGTDYPTADGTAVRDYIHVVDLAEGHVAALEALGRGERFGVYNLGTGQGSSVKQLLAAFNGATGVNVPQAAAPRRPGDVAAIYASTDKAGRELGWKAKRGLNEMCADSWRFAKRNDGAEE